MSIDLDLYIYRLINENIYSNGGSCKNLVETVDLTAEDVLLPMLECVVNSVISLQKIPIAPQTKKENPSPSYKRDLPEKLNFDNIKTILGYKVIDNLGLVLTQVTISHFKPHFPKLIKTLAVKELVDLQSSLLIKIL